MKKDIIYIGQKLQDYYGDLNWWPARTPYEVIVGAILTQNTAWSNVEKAIARLEGQLTPKQILAMDQEMLQDLIRPAGFFRQKSLYLKEITAWYAKWSFDPLKVQSQPFEQLRKSLLAVKGVGPETADSILLYAFNLPAFVVDAYTMRFLSRYKLAAGRNHVEVQETFVSALPRDVKIYNQYHALFVAHGKEHCRKKPVCNGCPLSDTCAREGVPAEPKGAKR